MEGVLVILAVAVAGAALLYLQWYQADQRRRGFAAVAAKMGLRYEATDRWNLHQHPFALFRTGNGRTAENVVYGTVDGYEVTAFDYSYYVVRSNGKTTYRQYYRFSCAMMKLPFKTPHTILSRESFMAGIARAVGLGDLQFESDEFNKAWNVKSDDARFANYLCDARMMHWLLASKGWRFELNGGRLLASCGQVKPHQLPRVIAAVTRFRGHVPSVVGDVFAR